MTLKKEHWNHLTEKEKYVILNGGTEYPFTGEYENYDSTGVYVCRQCEHPCMKVQVNSIQDVVGRVLMMK